MKKFLKVLCCVLLIGLIITLCYFFGGVRADINIPVGKYYLQEIVFVEDGVVKEKEPYEAEELYLEALEGKKIKSFSKDVAFIQDEKIYTYEVSGTHLTIKYDKEERYGGMFAEKLIIIQFTEKVKEGDKEIEKATQYHYYLKETN